MKLNLDLKQKPMSDMPKSWDLDAPHYPSFTFETDEEHNLPESGTMVVQFEKTSSTDETRDGKTSYRCTVDVKKIVSVEGGKGKKVEGSDDEEADETKEEEAAETADDGDEAETDRSPAVDAVLKKKGKKSESKRSPAVSAVLGQASEGSY